MVKKYLASLVALGLITGLCVTPQAKATTWTTLDMPGAQETYIKGIDGNNLVGRFPDNGNHGFIYGDPLQPPEPVPEPTTMLLLASGLIGLAGFRRRFRKR